MSKIIDIETDLEKFYQEISIKLEEDVFNTYQPLCPIYDNSSYGIEDSLNSDTNDKHIGDAWEMVSILDLIKNKIL